MRKLLSGRRSGSLPSALQIGYTDWAPQMGIKGNCEAKPMPKRRKKNSSVEPQHQAAPRSINTQKRIADMTADEYRKLAISLQESLNGRRTVRH